MNRDKHWHHFDQAPELGSPALLFYPGRIRDNIDLMIKIAGNPNRLRPHIKTHKTAEIIKLQREKGIEKFKCATLSEARLLGQCGARDILLAMQPVGPNKEFFFKLSDEFPQSRFSSLVDNAETLKLLSAKASHFQKKISLWLDLNNGMNRTGIQPGPPALELYKEMHLDPWIEARGIHAYDGQIHQAELEKRKELCAEAILPVLQMKKSLEDIGIEVKNIIAGGSPTFGIYAENKELELSPGTTLLWDAGYADKYPDLPFKIAATLLTRVVSRPKDKMICTDLGHKAVASEMPMPRVIFPDHPELKQIGHSEEHLILQSTAAQEIAVGQELYAIPMHICPTVSKYSIAHTIEENTLKGSWKIKARDHEFNGSY